MQFGWLNFGCQPNQDHPMVYGWRYKGSNKFPLAGKQTVSAGSLWTGGSTSQWVCQPVAQRVGDSISRISPSRFAPKNRRYANFTHRFRLFGWRLPSRNWAVGKKCQWVTTHRLDFQPVCIPDFKYFHLKFRNLVSPICITWSKPSSRNSAPF